MSDYLTDLFTYSDDAPMLPEHAERDLILRAQAGDDDATLTLAGVYGRVLRASVAKFGRHMSTGGGAFAEDDAQMIAFEGFLEAVRMFDPARGKRLAVLVPGRVAKAFERSFADALPSRVAPRTLARFNKFITDAEGDLSAAEDLADASGEMTRSHFRDVLRVARETGSLEAEFEGAGHEVRVSPVGPYTGEVCAEDALMVEIAFDAVDSHEGELCRLAYGFTPVVEYVDGVPVEVDRVPDDAEVARILGGTRPTIQRKRSKALDKMREALAASIGGEL